MSRVPRAPISTAQPEHDQGSSGEIVTSAIAKWLIPSVTVLFVVVGYIAQTAQEGLLGLGLMDSDPNKYISSAADFFLGLIKIPTDTILDILSGNGISFAHHLPWLVGGSLLTFFVVVPLNIIARPLARIHCDYRRLLSNSAI